MVSSSSSSNDGTGVTYAGKNVHRTSSTTTRVRVRHDGGVGPSSSSSSSSSLFGTTTTTTTMTTITTMTPAVLVAGLVILWKNRAIILSSLASLLLNRNQYHLSSSSSMSTIDLGPEWNVPSKDSIQVDGTNSDEILKQEIHRITSSVTCGISSKGTRIVDSFVQNKSLLEYFAQDSVWRDCFMASGGYQWMDVNTNNNNNNNNNNNTNRTLPDFKDLWQEMAYSIWQDEPEFRGAIGLEYWCNILTPEIPLEWHVDKDEGLFFFSPPKQQLRTPTMGAVWYGFPHVLTGGYLELLPYGPGPTFSRPVALAGRQIERIRPLYNRAVYLNVSHWHGVSPIFRGSRYTLAVNVWHDKRPMAVLPPKDMQQQHKQEQMNYGRYGKTTSP